MKNNISENKNDMPTTVHSDFSSLEADSNKLSEHKAKKLKYLAEKENLNLLIW